MPSKEEMEAWFEANRAKFAEERSRRIKENAETFSDGHSRIENNGEYVSDKSYDVDDMLAKYGHISEFLSQDANDANRKLGSDLLKILSSLKDKYREGIITEEFLSEIKFEMYDTPSEEYYEYLSGTEFVNEISKEATKTDRALTAVRLILDARFSQTDSAKRVFTNKEIAKANKFIQGKDEIIEKEYMDELIAYAKSIGIDYFSDELLSGGNVLGAFNTDKIKIDVDDVNSFDRDDFLNKFSGGEAFSNAETDYAKGEYARNVEPYFGKKQVKMLEKEKKNVFDCILINGHSLNNLYPEFAEIENVKERENKLKLAFLFQSRLEDNKIEYVFPMQKEDKIVFSDPVRVESDYFKKLDIAKDELNADMDAVNKHVRRNVLGIKVDDSDLYKNIISASNEYQKAATDEEKTQKAELLKNACLNYLEKRKNPITSDGKTRFNNVSKLFISLEVCEKERVKNRDRVHLSGVEIDRLSEMILISEGKDLSDVVEKGTLIRERRAAERKAVELLTKLSKKENTDEIDIIFNDFKKNIFTNGYYGMEKVFTKIDETYSKEEAALKKQEMYKRNSKYVSLFANFGKRFDPRENEGYYTNKLLFVNDFVQKIMAGYVGAENVPIEEFRKTLTDVGLIQSDRFNSVFFNAKMFKLAEELSKIPERERRDKIKEYAATNEFLNDETSIDCVKAYYEFSKENPIFGRDNEFLKTPDIKERIEKQAKLFMLAREITMETELPDILNMKEINENRSKLMALYSIVIECSQDEQKLRKKGDLYFEVYDDILNRSELNNSQPGEEKQKRSYKEHTDKMDTVQVYTNIYMEIKKSLDPDSVKNYPLLAAQMAYLDFCKENGKFKPGMKAAELDPNFWDFKKYMTFSASFSEKLKACNKESLKNYVFSHERPSADFMDTVKNHMKEIGLEYKEPDVTEKNENQSEKTNFMLLSEEDNVKHTEKKYLPGDTSETLNIEKNDFGK